MPFDYEAAKAEFGVSRAREMEKESRGATSAQSDAPQATSQPQGEAGSKKAGVGGEGWNEDFDEAWGRRVLENPKLKDLFGLSDYSSLRDEETRRQVNRWLRENRGGGEAGAGAAAVVAQPAAATSTTGAAKAAVTQPAGTTGKTSLPGGVSTPPAAPPQRSTSVLAPGRLPSGVLWRNTIVPASGGEIPQMNGPWWPSYPVGNAPLASKPATASFQAAALEQQRS